MASRYERIYPIQDIEPPTRSELFAAREILYLYVRERNHDALKLMNSTNMTYERLNEICLYLVEHSLL